MAPFFLQAVVRLTPKLEEGMSMQRDKFFYTLKASLLREDLDRNPDLIKIF